jgi:hypothetical protein
LTLRLTAAWRGAAYALIAGVFIVGELWIGTRTFSAALCLFALLVALIQTLAGSLALRAGGLTDIRAGLPAAFCVGFVCLSLPMFALCSLFAMSAFTAFMACAAVVVVMGICFRTSGPLAEPAANADVAVGLLIAVAIAVLTRAPVASALSLELTGALPIWSDYFLHGVTISSFGGPFASGTDMELPGVSRVFYHYAPFMLSAAIQPVSGQSGLALSTSVLLPLGVLIAAMGCYTFAVQIGGRAAGLLAVTAVVAVPVFRAPLQSGWLDFYWMILTAPGAGYAIGVSMVVCAVAVLYVERGGARAFWVMALLLLSIILVRVHFFMLLAPAIAMLTGLRHRWVYGRTMLLGLCAVAISVLICVLAFPALRGWYMAHSDPIKYLDFALQYTRWYGRAFLLPERPLAIMIIVKVALALIAVLGAYAFVYPVLMIAVRIRFGLGRADWLAPFVVLVFVGLMLLAPTAGNGDFTEYKHRHFPLLYVVVATYALVYACRLLFAALGGESPSLRRGASVLALAVFALAMLASRGVNPAKPDVEAMPWGADFHNQRVEPGLLESARYMRTRARAGDILAMAGGATSGQSRTLVDLVSITDIPAFLARSELRLLGASCVQKTVEMRVAALERIAFAADWPEARHLLRDNAIRWFVAPAGDGPQWDPARKDAAYSSDGMSVYDVGVRAVNARPPTEGCR